MNKEGIQSNQMLKAEIASQYEKATHAGRRSPIYIIARALVKLGIDRGKTKAGGGWTCGNHTNAVRVSVEAKLGTEYTKDEMNKLILYCVSGNGDKHYETILSDISE